MQQPKKRGRLNRIDGLQKAFSGQFAPQDPNDEPATALLDRIAKEKEEAAARTKKAKTAKKRVKKNRTSTRRASS